MTYESDNPQFDHLINNLDGDWVPPLRPTTVVNADQQVHLAIECRICGDWKITEVLNDARRWIEGHSHSSPSLSAPTAQTEAPDA